MKISFEWITLIVTSGIALLSSYITWHLYRKEADKTYLKERFEKVIYPVFNLMDPYLYKKEIDSDTIKAFQECKVIVEEHRMIAGGKLLFLFHDNLNETVLSDFSKYIDKEYDTCCSALGIPLRPMEYKIRIFGVRNLRLLFLFAVKYTFIFLFTLWIFFLLITIVALLIFGPDMVLSLNQ